MSTPVWLSLRGLDGRGIEAQMAWNNVNSYRFVAGVQLKRIMENNKIELAPEHLKLKLAEEFGLTQAEYLDLRDLQSAQATADAHFYLNCWRIVALNVYRIIRAVSDPELDRFLVEQHCTENKNRNGLYFGNATRSFTLGWYAQGRDDFEHIDERILGGRNWEKVRTGPDKIVDLTGNPKPKDVAYYPSPFFNGTHMVVGDRTWEITAHAHNLLNTAVKRVEEIGIRLLKSEEHQDGGDPEQ